MATLNGSKLVDLVKRIVGFGDAASDDEYAVKMLLRPATKWVVHGEPTDTANDSYRYVLDGGLDSRVFIEEVKVVCDDTVTANGTNYKTISLVNNDAAAGSDTTIGSLSTASTGFTGKVARSMTLTAANQVVASGQQLEVVVAATAAGVVLTGLSVIVKGRPI